MEEVISVVAPDLDLEAISRQSRILHALVDGLGVSVSLWLLAADDGVRVLRDHLQDLA